MKHYNLYIARAALLSAAAFLVTPALAQQTAPVTPPVAAPAPAPTVAPAPPPTTAPQAAPTNATSGASDVPGADKNSTTPINPAAAAAAEAEAAERGGATSTAGRASRPSGTRPATVRRRVINAGAAARATPAEPAAAPEAATPTEEPTPTPEAAAPTREPTSTPEVAPSVEEAASAPVAVDNAVETQSTTTEPGGPPWLLIILGVLVVAGIVAFAMSRRRRDSDSVERPIAPAPVAEPYVEPVAVTPVAVPVAEAERDAEPEPFVPASLAETPTVAEPTEPVDVAPAVAEDATVKEPADADVAALTAGSPAGDRPWLELAMRPIRAGTNVDQALVEIELTVGNAGTVAAEDVRISTFMLPAGSDIELDRLLSQSRVDAAVEPLTIAAGEGTRVDATLALPRAELMANDATTFQPVVVADARYRLPDGGEGRTSASFIVGIASEGELGLLELDRPVLREDVEARLYRDPARV